MPEKVSKYDTSLLRNLIKEKYILFTRFEKKTGIKKSSLSQYLNGHRELSREKIDLFAEALDIKPHQYYMYFFKKKVCDKNTKE